MSHRKDDLEAFLSAPSSPPPRWVGDEIALTVRRDLNPGLRHIASKLLGVHALSALASLWLCPQFGVELRSGAPSIMDFLSPYGTWACAAGCGIAFSGVTALASAVFLSRDERRVLRGWDIPAFSALISLSWGTLMLAGSGAHTHGVEHSTAEFALVWAISGIAACVAAVRLSTRSAKIPTPSN